MPVAMQDVMRMLCSISEKKKMLVAVEPSNRCRRLAIGGAILGALLGGPPGLAVGGTLGGLLGKAMTDDPFKPVHKILLVLSQDQRRKLFDRVKAIIWNLRWINNMELMELVMRSESLQQQLADMLVDFLKTELTVDVQFGDHLLGAGVPRD
ncbi:protein C19orf12 homolog [Pteronotus mesoamericanus]|uniref:protein C19orf12 homolog n=1 Tax=Pteronotus mesoamericanus TaxID=1884717 RepID=UPI0023EBE1D8|nr:protein C19orf12 homolog [Pteronotus parnellii mesoamericanus]